ncbi:MAG TPA: hypothetical protein VLL75_06620, partial [Vicinamibacteria bacterium]|nr:hypothetical protein [Vicinamibacteria bacterium]
MTSDTNRATALFGWLLCGAGLAAALPQAPSERPSFPAQAEVVTVDVVATGRDGDPVVDLRREDFRVAEDGVPQEIVAFEAVHRPSTEAARGEGGRAVAEAVRSSSNQGLAARAGSHFVIVFDELHLTPAESARARTAVASFLANGVADGDRVVLVGTAEGNRWTARIPEGRDALLKALDRLEPGLVGR